VVNISREVFRWIALRNDGKQFRFWTQLYIIAKTGRDGTPNVLSDPSYKHKMRHKTNAVHV